MDKKVDAWKKFQNKMKDKRSSKKKRTLHLCRNSFLIKLQA